MRCRHKKNEDCGLLSFERPDFCDELCEEFVPADLPEAEASAERISSVVRSNATIGWISVKERLPEDMQVVAFIIDKSVNYYGGSICAGRFRYFDYKDGSDKSPEFSTWGLGGLTASHWMPLPEPPEV